MGRITVRRYSQSEGTSLVAEVFNWNKRCSKKTKHAGEEILEVISSKQIQQFFFIRSWFALDGALSETANNERYIK